MTKTIGILTGGGDVPGLNPAIKSVAMSAFDAGYKMIGIRKGWSGLLHYNLDEPLTHDYYARQLTKDDVRTVDRSGGTFAHITHQSSTGKVE